MAIAFIITTLACGFLLSKLHVLDVIPNRRLNHNPQYEAALSYLIAAILIGATYLSWSVLRLRREIEWRRTAEAEALDLAESDPLTGLPNRRKFYAAFPALASDLPPGLSRAVMMLDIDGFKPINDVYGHTFGDELLQIFAARLVETVEPDGFVARLGGDEFVIVTPGIRDQTDVERFAEDVLARFQDRFTVGTRRVSIGTGIGIALYPDDGYSASELLRRADIALYRAKKAGRLSYRFFEVDMDASILHRTLLEQRLRGAVERGDVKVHYQPILDLQNQEVIGFEALARWTDQELGVVPPSEFIAVAEDGGMIADLTDHLLREACLSAKAWPSHIYISFNISPAQLHDRGLPLKIISILADTGFRPENLVLEITETSIMRNPTAALEILTQLSKAKIQIALDDFGTGHSSLAFLKDYPINKVKIDKSFTMNMTQNRECAAIVDAVLILSEGLGFDTVAEGIEQPDVLQRLNDAGCRFGQGFLFGAAEPAEQANRRVIPPNGRNSTAN
ncbi:MAG: EAL domain-containing protein [Roseibium sp.]|nr:EAL domain-containing protein [Roseibium sp.]